MEIVNGYPCKNCTDVSLARRGIDPAKPKDGPNGAYAAESSRQAAQPADARAERAPAVTFGGALAKITPSGPADRIQPYRPGASFTFTV